MRLVELEPRWSSPPHLGDGVVIHIGVTFLCPGCRKHRAGVMFRRPVVVAMPDAPGFGWPENSQGWDHSGATFEALSLSPSVLVRYPDASTMCWHGRITDGAVIAC